MLNLAAGSSLLTALSVGALVAGYFAVFALWYVIVKRPSRQERERRRSPTD